MSALISRCSRVGDGGSSGSGRGSTSDDTGSTSTRSSSSTSSSTSMQKAAACSSTDVATSTGAAGLGWRQLLHDFQAPGMEQSFLEYKYQQTVPYDTCAAIHHTLIAIAHVMNYPSSTWHEPATQRGMLGFVIAHALPALFVRSCRWALGARGREMAVLMVETAAALQAVGVALGWLPMPEMASSRMSQGSGLMDDLLMVVGLGVMRAYLSQARVKLFAPFFLFYMLCGSMVSIVGGMGVAQALARYARVTLVSVALSAMLELHARSTFLRVLAGNGCAKKGTAGSLDSKKHNKADMLEEQHSGMLDEQQSQQQPQPQHLQQQPEKQPRQRQQQQQQQQHHEPLLLQAQQNQVQHLLETIIAMGGTQAAHSSVSGGEVTTGMEALIGPAFCQRMVDSLPQHPNGWPKPKPYRAHSRRYQAGVKVRVEGHAPGSAGFQRISQALTSAVHEAADGLVAAGTAPELMPRVHATCIQGCVQLLAGICVPQGALPGSGQDTAAAVHGLQTALEQLVRSRLQDLWPDKSMPQFDVVVAADSSSNVSSWAVGAAAGATPTGRLLACTPPCLEAGAGSTELQLLVSVDASVSASSSADAGGNGTYSAELVVWDAGAASTPLVVHYHVHAGLNLLELTAPNPEEPGLLHMALLLGNHTLAFVQPLLTLPAAAAAEMRNLWASAMLHAAHAASSASATQQQPGQQDAPHANFAAGLLESFADVLAPLLADIAYIVGCTAPSLVDVHKEWHTAHTRSASGEAVVPTMLAQAATMALSGQHGSKPWKGGAAAASYQALMLDMLSYLHDADMRATIQYVCSAAAASGRTAVTLNSTDSSEQDVHAQQQEEEGQQQRRPRQSDENRQGQGIEWKEQGHLATSGCALPSTCAAAKSAMRGGAVWQMAAHPSTLLQNAASSSRKVGTSSNIPSSSSMPCRSTNVHYSSTTAATNAEDKAPAHTADAAWRQLLFGFSEPGLEQRYLAYKYHHTGVTDTCAAVYHGLVALATISNFPAGTLRRLDVQFGIFGWVLLFGWPAVLIVLQLRPRLSPRGREVCALLTEFLMAIMNVCMWLKLMAIPETIAVKMVDVSSARDEVAVVFATGVIRPLLSQARTRLLIPSTLVFFAAAACLAASLGMPLHRVAFRYGCLTVVATAMSCAHEVYSRGRFLVSVSSKGRSSKGD